MNVENITQQVEATSAAIGNAPIEAGKQNLEDIYAVHSVVTELRAALEGLRAVTAAVRDSQRNLTDVWDTAHIAAQSFSKVQAGTDNGHLMEMGTGITSLDGTAKDAAMSASTMSRTGFRALSGLETVIELLDKTFTPALDAAATAAELSLHHQQTVTKEGDAYIRQITLDQ